MSTNYYTELEECGHCNRFRRLHLGKRSAGWQFTFQYNSGEFYKSVIEMQAWLSDKDIFNEYGEKMNHDDFWQMIEIRQNDPVCRNHAEYCRKQYGKREDTMLIDGYSFINSEFS